MIQFTFDLKKIVQIVHYLLKRNNGIMNYTKLIKLLYIADRTCLDRWNFTITGDTYFSLKNGPVLNKLFDLIKNSEVSFDLDKEDHYYWSTYFTKDGYNLKTLTETNLGLDLLCDAEEDILNEIDSKYKSYSYSQMIDEVHNKKLFSEVKWDELNDKLTNRIPLTIVDILKALGRTEEDIQFLEQEQEQYSIETQMLKQL